MPAGKGTYGKKRGRPPGSKTTAKGKAKPKVGSGSRGPISIRKRRVKPIREKAKPIKRPLGNRRRVKHKGKAAKPKNKRRFF